MTRYLILHQVEINIVIITNFCFDHDEGIPLVIFWNIYLRLSDQNWRKRSGIMEASSCMSSPFVIQGIWISAWDVFTFGLGSEVKVASFLN